METYVVSESNGLAKVLRTFALSLFVAAIGTLVVGPFVPETLFLPLIVVTFIMLLAAFFMRRRKAVSYPFLFIFTFISGITLYPSISYYTSTMGASMVGMVFLLTGVIFTAISIYATITKRDFSFLGSFLMVALLTMIGIYLYGMFVPLSSGSHRALAGVGVVVFSGYILYDVKSNESSWYIRTRYSAISTQSLS